MRVLQIIKGLDIGNLHGGAERFAADLAISLKNKGVDVVVCAFFGVNTEQEKQWKSLFNNEGIHCFTAIEWKGHRNFKNYYFGIRNLLAELNGSPVDICHSHFQLGTATSILLKAKGITKIAIRTSHVTQEWEKGWYGYLGEHIFSKWIFPFIVDCEVGVSNEITRHLSCSLASKIKKRKPICIHNAIPNQVGLVEKIQLIHHPKPGTNVIAIVGRLSEEKGHRYLIEAAKKLTDLHENVEIWVIGDGYLRDDLENMVQRFNLNGVIHFFGQRADVPDLIQQVDLVVVPSLREGFPSVILESFQLGIPVVGTDVSGIKELIIPDESGWLVPSANSEKLAETIRIALTDSEKRKQYIQAGKKIAAEYTIDHITNQYLELYRELLKEQNRLV